MNLSLAQRVVQEAQWTSTVPAADRARWPLVLRVTGVLAAAGAAALSAWALARRAARRVDRQAGRSSGGGLDAAPSTGGRHRQFLTQGPGDRDELIARESSRTIHSVRTRGGQRSHLLGGNLMDDWSWVVLLPLAVAVITGVLVTALCRLLAIALTGRVRAAAALDNLRVP